MALNILIFLAGYLILTTDQMLSQFYYDYALIPARISAGENYIALITSMFLHAGFMHLAGNMLFLWVFGDNLEDKMGPIWFLIFYIASGVGAGLVHVFVDLYTPIPLVGASGAIAGVMGGYLLLFPKAKVDIFIFLIVFIRILPIPAWVMLGLWFAIQLFSGISTDISDGGVAYWAHAGGFIVGFVLTIPLWLRLGSGGWWVQTDFHPAHPDATYSSRFPVIKR